MLTLVAILLLAFAIPVEAVPDGELDGEGHPWVLLLMDVGGQPAFRCSATLLSPTAVLTSGHYYDIAETMIHYSQMLKWQRGMSKRDHDEGLRRIPNQTIIFKSPGDKDGMDKNDPRG